MASRSTLVYLDPNNGTIKYSYVPWETLNGWLSHLNGIPQFPVDVPKGVNRGNVIDELLSRRTQKIGVVATGARLLGRDLGYGNNWREYENQQGYTHLEELLMYQPEDWRKQAREYMFEYQWDLKRRSSNEKRQVEVTISPDGVPETTSHIFMHSPVLVVLFHLDIPRSRRYEPLNFLLAYGVPNPLPELESRFTDDKLYWKAVLDELSPVDYFFDFQEAVQSYKLDALRAIGNENKFPRLCLMKELDFSDIIGQRLAEQIIREEVIQYFWNRSSREEMLEDRQPLSMIFAGPSGNGKTKLARQLAELMNKPEDNCFIKIDCGKLSRGEEIFGLSGAYQGASEGSALNNFVLRMHEKTESLGIVLLDEIEKAHESVIHGLYQVLDKGEWTNKKLCDGSGVQTETIPCHNIIFIMTTNAADRSICDQAKSTPQFYTARNPDELEELHGSIETLIRTELQRTPPFKHAFIGRVGRIVPFFPMAKANANDTGADPLLGEMMTVAKILIEREQQKQHDLPWLGGSTAGITQKLSARTKHKMAQIVVNEAIVESGVRSIQKGVASKMGKRMRHSLLIETGGIQDGSTVRYSASVEEKKIDFRVEETRVEETLQAPVEPCSVIESPGDLDRESDGAGDY